MNKSTSHGHTRTVNGKRILSSEYISWLSMRDRCMRPGKPRYYGMPIDEVWKFSFEQFLLDMGPKPSPKHTIDRIRSDQGYFPDNCRWATKKEQGTNRVDNPFPGMSVEDAAKAAGISTQTVRGRIANGWPREKWLDPDAKNKIRRFTKSEVEYIQSSSKSTAEIAKELGAKYRSVFSVRKYRKNLDTSQ